MTADTYIDDIAVERAVHGDPVRLTKHERAHAIRLMTERGHSAAQVADRLRISERTVVRHRASMPPRPARRSRYQTYQWPHPEEWQGHAARHTGEVLVALCRLLDAGSDAVTVGDTLTAPGTDQQDLGPVIAVESAIDVLRTELHRLMSEYRPQPPTRPGGPFFTVPADAPDGERVAIEELNARIGAMLLETT